MKTIAEYIEQAFQFERMAAEATDPKLRESLHSQALAYRSLAEKRMAQLPPINLPAVHTPTTEKDGPP